MVVFFSEPGSTLPSSTTAVEPNGTVAIANRAVDGFEMLEDDDADWVRPEFSGLTVAKVNGNERGSSDLRDAAASVELPGHATVEKVKHATERKALAKRLCHLMGRILASHGKAKMRADVAVLRQELSRSHEKLGRATCESDYLSIVTLVESNLATMDWKDAQRAQLKRVAEVLHFGTQDQLTFDDYSKAVKVLRGQMLPTGPTFEIDVDESESDGE